MIMEPTVVLALINAKMVKEIVTVIQTAKLAFAVVWTIVTLALGFLITMTVAMAQVWSKVKSDWKKNEIQRL